MSTRLWHVVAALVAGLMTLSQAGCGGGSQSQPDSFTVGLLLPSRSVPRWEHSDKPLIEKRLKELCPRCAMEYANAETTRTDSGNS